MSALRGKLTAALCGFVCAVPLVVAGFGSAPAAGAAEASAPGVTAKTITLGLIASVTGPASSTFGDSATGAQARIDLQNAEGGVDGRKLQLVTEDDQTTTLGNEVAAQALVSKPVFGVMVNSTEFEGGAPGLLKLGVPVTESVSPTGDEPQYTNEFTFIQGQSPTPATTTQAVAFKDLGTGIKNVAYMSYNDPEDALGLTAFQSAMKAEGLNVCYSALVPIGAVDFTANVLAMKNANCQALDFPAVESSDVAMATAIRQAGANIKQFYFTGYDQNFLDDSAGVAAAQDQYFGITFPLDLKTPAVTTFYSALKKYDPAYKGGIASFGAQYGWALTDEMIEGLKAAGQNPTRASWIKNLAKVTDYTVGGLHPSGVNLSKRWKLVGPQCQYFVQLEGTKYLPWPRNGEPVCGKVITG